MRIFLKEEFISKMNSFITAQVGKDLEGETDHNWTH
jgi:hypothetical protein